MATLETSLKANYDRRTDRQTKRLIGAQATYRSAQKISTIIRLHCPALNIINDPYELNVTSEPSVYVCVWGRGKQAQTSVSILEKEFFNDVM